MCPNRAYDLCHLMNATEVTTGLAESNGSLLPDGWLKVTCGLTARTPILAPGPMLGNEYGQILHFLLCRSTAFA